jgi:hypothetical protein
MGGLGNQMFQYSLGRRLAIDNGVPLKLDLTFFSSQDSRTHDTPREYALSGWALRADVATAADLALFSEPARNRFSRMLHRFMPRPRGHIVREEGFGYQPCVLAARPPSLLVGYWQSERYFAAIAATLRAEFTLHKPACEHIAGFLHTLPDPGAISLHVRRGDYVRNEQTHAYHGVCSVDYYLQACNAIARRVPKPRFIVFSDEPEWAINHLRLPWPTTVVRHTAACVPHGDMWLMSRCSHHIIANSSFSWWGAWLGQNPEKIVVAPKRWFNVDHDTSDLIPPSWVRL